MSDRRVLHAGTEPVFGTVPVPGSKSVANRALAIAALAAGDSELSGLPDGDDTVAMLSCLTNLGVAVEVAGDTAFVSGGGGVLRPTGRLDTRLAGTTSRFVTALAALADVAVVIDGDPPLRARPMAQLHGALVSLGARIDYGDTPGHLPISITGPLRTGGSVSLRGDVSSQFITALMLIGPLLDGGLTIELSSPLVSEPYVKLTAAVMAAFGVDDVSIDPRQIAVPSGQYAGRRYHIEPDASSASYPLAVAAARGGRVSVPGLTVASQQGDIAILDLLDSMGCFVDASDTAVAVSRTPDHPLTGIDVDMADTSDLVPTIAVLAALASTPTTIRGVGFIRSKESDRLGDLAGELRKTGAGVDVTPDGLRFQPTGTLHRAELGTHHDHRLAMAFAVLGSVVDGIVVDGAGTVTKSWPGFWTAYDDLLLGEAGSPSNR